MSYANNKSVNKKNRGRKVFAVVVLIVALTVFLGASYIAFSAPFEGRSATSKLFETAIDCFMNGDKYVSPQKTDEKIERRRRNNEGWRVPNFLKSLYGFETELYGDFEICRFNPDAENTVYYFHGGSFMWQPLVLHYNYCRYLAKELGVEIIMPVYPKAPNYGYMDVMEWLYGIYMEEGVDAIAFFGDSAGASIAISFSQYLYDNGVAPPNDTVVFSPCLDLSLTNPEIASYAHNDPMLNAPDLKRKIETYVNDGNYDNPYANPVKCDFESLGTLTIFIGTLELLLPDARKLHGELTERGIEHNYFEYENQFHTFEIFPMTERYDVAKKIKYILSKSF